MLVLIGLDPRYQHNLFSDMVKNELQVTSYE